MKNVIYKISNNINNKIYIGSAKKFNTRVNVHKSYLRKGNHHSRKLQNHVNKYGLDSLIFEIIYVCENQEDLIEREQYYIDKYKPFFNILKVANSRKGIKHTEESIKKMVETRRRNGSYKKGYKRDPELMKRIVETRVKNGYKPNQETKDKIRETLKNRVYSDDSLRNIREANKKRIGSKLSKEHIEKIRASQKTDKNYMKGRTKEKHHLFGKKHSEESKLKMKSRARKVIDTDTGIIYNNVTDCCIKLNIPKGTFGKYVSGLVKSKTNFKYYEEK